MSGLLKSSYDKVEGLRGKELVVTLVIVFVMFIAVGVLFGYYINIRLNDDELVEDTEPSVVIELPKEESHFGRVDHIDESIYGFSYVLVDREGNDFLYLTADDEKLAISEGLYVTVKGMRKDKATNEALDTLHVKEIIISYDTN